MKSDRLQIAFDIGGVISKYPEEFFILIKTLYNNTNEVDVHIITDQHNEIEVKDTLDSNGFFVPKKNIHNANYEKYGDACKAVIMREFDIDILIDDHPGYLVWPWPTTAPIRLLVQPDPRQPYWAKGWKCEGGDFGRRYYLGK